MKHAPQAVCRCGRWNYCRYCHADSGCVMACNSTTAVALRKNSERDKLSDIESLGLFQIVEPDQSIAVAMLQKAPQQVPKIASGPPIQTGAPAFSGKSSWRGRPTSKTSAAVNALTHSAPEVISRVIRLVGHRAANAVSQIVVDEVNSCRMRKAYDAEGTRYSAASFGSTICWPVSASCKRSRVASIFESTRKV